MGEFKEVSYPNSFDSTLNLIKVKSRSEAKTTETNTGVCVAAGHLQAGLILTSDEV